MSIPKDLSKKRDELALEYIQRKADKNELRFILEYMKEDWIAGYEGAFESEHVLALVEALENNLDNMEHYFENKCCPTKDELDQSKSALAKWSKRNE